MNSVWEAKLGMKTVAFRQLLQKIMLDFLMALVGYGSNDNG